MGITPHNGNAQSSARQTEICMHQRQGKWRRLLALCACLGIGLASAQAAPAALSLDRSLGDYPLERHVDYAIDDHARLTAAEMQAAPAAGLFRPQEGKSLNLGVTDDALWLRLRVDVRPAAAGRWLLVFDNAPLDRVEAFHAGKQVVGGDHLAASQRPYMHHKHVLPLELAAGNGQVILVRLQSTGNLNTSGQLVTPEVLDRVDQQDYLIYGIYFGMLLALAAYNLLLYLMLRDRAYLYYVLFTGCMILAMTSQYGFSSQFLWPGSVVWGDRAPTFAFSLASAFGALFARDFLQTRHRLPRLDILLRLETIVFALATLATLTLSYAVTLRAVSSLVPIFSLTCILAGWLVRRQGHAGASYFLLAWVILLFGGSTMTLRNIGLLPSNALTENLFPLCSGLEMLLLSFALANRIQNERQARERAQQEAVAAKHETIVALENARYELERTVAERTEALVAANNELERLAHYDNLTGVANRALLHDRLEQARSRAERDGQGFALLMIDLDGFKRVNDTWGHDTGDRLLIHVAQQLQANLRASDSVARLGGDEFVVILQSTSDPDGALIVGQKLLEAIRQPLLLDDGTALRAGCCIGVAVWSVHGNTAAALLSAADHAMYRAKAAGTGIALASDRS